MSPISPPAPLSEAQLLAAYAIFLASYLVFALGKFPGMKIDRPGAAIIGAVLMVVFRVVPPREALRFIDFGTLVLLFSMMLIVANLRLVGFFEWITALVMQLLRPHHLLPTVIFTCGLLSAFFVNDIICLVMVPFVLAVTRRMRMPPLPHLLAVATASNIGSVATITGNPQNMLIGSFSGIHYREFLWRLAPVALVGLFLDWGLLQWLCRRQLSATGPALDSEVSQPAIRLGLLLKPGIVVGLVVAGFFAGVAPPVMAAAGAAALLISRTLEPRRLYDEVNWGLLVFFVGLFLIVGGAERAGIPGLFLQFAAGWNWQHPAVFATLAALLSNLVSNVPAVMLLKSLVPGFANPRTAWLLLAMASTLAGNMTITGSVANIIVVESARPQAHIGFRDYFRVGLPITLLTLLAGTAWLALAR